MKGLLIALAGLVVLLVAAVFVGPGLVDWNAYRDDLAAQVRDLTGREVSIQGDMNLEVLPAPTLSAENVRLANVEGGSSPDMMALDSLRVRVAPLPLLQGELRVETLVLVRPEILLEVLPDGRRNWQFRTASEGTAAGEGADMPRVRVDSFLIRDGTLVYRDPAGGVEERITSVNAEIVAESLNGPFSVNGDAAVRGLTAAFDLAVGRVATDGATPFNVTLGLPGVKGQAKISGALSLYAEPMAARGGVSVEGPNLAAVLDQLGADAPAALARRFSLEGDFNADETRVQAEGIDVQLADTSATADVDLAVGEPLTLHARLGLKRLDLDELLAAGGGDAGTPGAQAPDSVDLPLPRGVTGSVEVAVDALVFRGQVVRQARASLGLEDGAVRLDQALALLPGGSDIALSGRLAKDEKGPHFAGRVEAASDNLRAVLAWLGADVGTVPRERLRRMNLSANVSARPELVQLTDIDLDLDVSEITGGVAIALRQRPGFGIGLTVDKLALEGYLPQPEDGEEAEAQQQGAAPLASGLTVLQGFDANFDLRVGTLNYRGTTARDVRFDATLDRGDLTLRQLGVGDLAGTSLDLQGKATEIAAAPSFDGAFSAEVPNVPQLAQALGLEAGEALAKLGRVNLAGEVKANAEAVTFDAALRALDGRITAKGEMTPLAGPPSVSAAMTASHPELADLARRLGAKTEKAVGKLDLSAQVSATPTTVNVRKLAGRAGPVDMEGRVDVGLDGPRPRIVGQLKTGPLPVEVLAVAGAGSETGGGGGVGRRWSREPIDLAGLRALDGELALDAEALVTENARLEQARLDASLADGVLTVRRLAGKLFDGSLELAGRVDSRSSVAADATVQATDVNVGPLLARGFDFDRVSGPVSLDAEFATQGGSEAELVSALSGKGAVEGTLTVKVKQEEQALGAVLGLLGEEVKEIRGLADAGTTVLGAFAGEPAELDGTFTVKQGVARTTDTRLTGRKARLALSGQADLPRWSMDAKADLYRPQDEGGDPYLTALLKGPLDEPNPTVKGKPFQPRPESSSTSDTESGQTQTTGETSAQQPEQPAKPEDKTKQLIEGILDKLRD